MSKNRIEYLTDVVTGRPIPNIGAEENRQAVERFLIHEKGFSASDIEVDAPIDVYIDGECYQSVIDLIVNVNGKRFLAIKCAAGSLGSWEREILAAARLLEIPMSGVSDGKTALIWDTASGKVISEGLDTIASKSEAARMMESFTVFSLSEERRKKEAIIFRSYDSMNINRRKRDERL